MIPLKPRSAEYGSFPQDAPKARIWVRVCKKWSGVLKYLSAALYFKDWL